MTLSDKDIITYVYNEWNIRTILAVRDSHFIKSKVIIYSLNKYSIKGENLDYRICRNRFEIALRIILLRRTRAINFVQFLASEPILSIIFTLKKFNRLIHIDDGSMFLNSHIGGLIKVSNRIFKLKTVISGVLLPKKKSYLDLSNIDYAFLFNLDLFKEGFAFNCKRHFSLNEIVVKQIKTQNINNQLIYKNKPILFGSAMVEHGYVPLDLYCHWIKSITDQYDEYLYVPHPSERNLESKLDRKKGRLLQIGLVSEDIICSTRSLTLHCFASTPTFVLSPEYPSKSFYVHLVPSLQEPSLIQAISSRNNIMVKLLCE
jgi:hypothetical protein